MRVEFYCPDDGFQMHCEVSVFPRRTQIFQFSSHGEILNYRVVDILFDFLRSEYPKVILKRLDLPRLSLLIRSRLRREEGNIEIDLERDSAEEIERKLDLLQQKQRERSVRNPISSPYPPYHSP